MQVNASLYPISSKDFGFAQAQHLLNRAGFGGTPRQIEALKAMGRDKAVDHLVEYQKTSATDLAGPDADPDIIRPQTREQRIAMRKARRDGDEALISKMNRERNMRRVNDRRQLRQIEQLWLGRMIATPRPLEEKLTLFWHGHFASNHRTVRDSYLMLEQNALFRRHANGSFVNLAHGVIKDPAMLRFLDNNRNVKRKPNENLARELMELFTLGEGNYTEDDIKNGARALTGYSFHDNDFAFLRRQHDEGDKVILGKRGKYNGEDFVNILLGRKDCPNFIAYKLYKYFVSDLSGGMTRVAASVIRRLGQRLTKSRYELRPVLKMLFKSRHFYDPAIVGNVVKSPAQLVVGSMRILNPPSRDVSLLAEAMTMMGQALFNPPTVAGWNGGRSWINTSTLFIRQNLCTYLITGKLPFEDNWSRDKIDYNPMFLLDQLPSRSPETVVEHLMTALVGSGRASARRAQLVDFITDSKGGLNRDSLTALLTLITAMPEYQLC